jgi:hypothetical protein
MRLCQAANDDKAELQVLARVATKQSSDSSDVSTWQRNGTQRKRVLANRCFLEAQF